LELPVLIVFSAGRLGQTLYQNLVDGVIGVIPEVIGAIAVLLLTKLAINLTERLMQRALKSIEPTLRKFLTEAAKTLVLIVGLVMVLDTLGIESTTLIAVVGAAGLAVGLALQNTLSHFAAGAMLIIFRPFEVGDEIEGAGVAGMVDSIGIFSTTLVTADNVKIVVPNNTLFSGTLKNLTTLQTRRVDLQIDIGDRPINFTINSFLERVRSHPLVLDQPQPTCHVFTISPTGTILYLRPWCLTRHYEQVHAEVLQQVKEALITIDSAAAG